MDDEHPRLRACQRDSRQGNVSGGLTGSIDMTRLATAAIASIFLHDKDDTASTLAMGMHARDAFLMQNGSNT